MKGCACTLLDQPAETFKTGSTVLQQIHRVTNELVKGLGRREWAQPCWRPWLEGWKQQMGWNRKPFRASTLCCCPKMAGIDVPLLIGHPVQVANQLGENIVGADIDRNGPLVGLDRSDGKGQYGKLIRAVAPTSPNKTGHQGALPRLGPTREHNTMRATNHHSGMQKQEIGPMISNIPAVPDPRRLNQRQIEPPPYSSRPWRRS